MQFNHKCSNGKFGTLVGQIIQTTQVLSWSIEDKGIRPHISKATGAPSTIEFGNFICRACGEKVTLPEVYVECFVTNEYYNIKEMLINLSSGVVFHQGVNPDKNTERGMIFSIITKSGKNDNLLSYIQKFKGGK